MLAMKSGRGYNSFITSQRRELRRQAERTGMNELTERKRVVIIGGGVAGLTAGIYACWANFDVTLYEKYSTLGGACSGWDREGYHIDNCIRWMRGTKPGSELYKIWETVGALGDDIEVFRPDPLLTSELDGERASLWLDPDRTERELLALSPEDAAPIRELMQWCRAVKNDPYPADHPPELTNMAGYRKIKSDLKATNKLCKHYRGQDILDLMLTFKHPLIRQLIADLCPPEALAQSFAMTYGAYISGDGGVPRGGSRAMIDRMRQRFEKLGGRYFLNTPVEEIIHEGELGTGVVLESGGFVPADFIVAACDPAVTFGRMLDLLDMHPVMRGMYEEPESYLIYGMFQAAFAVDCAEDVVGGAVVLDCTDIQDEIWMGNRMTVRTFSHEPDFAPEGKQILQISIDLTEDAYDDWKALLQDEPEKYKEKKETLAKAAMGLVEERFPEYRGKLTLLDTWTPASYQKRLASYRGWPKAFTVSKKSIRNPYPPAIGFTIDNLIVASQWLSPPGGLAAAASQGKFAILRVLNQEGAMARKSVQREKDGGKKSLLLWGH